MSAPMWRKPSRPTSRLSGHELFNEGAAFDAKGRHKMFIGTGGEGYGKCSCGALSPKLKSGGQRKAWHKAHKDEIREAQG